jgi:DNA-binding NarL/FixJ family response regulator
MAIRVLVVETHVSARDAIVTELGRDSETEVVAAVAGDLTGEELLELAREKQADVVIVDFNAGTLGADAFDVVKAITQPVSDVRLLALIQRVDGILLRRLTSSRVTGCLFSDDPCVQSLAEIVHRVHGGIVTYSPRSTNRCFDTSRCA